MTDKEIKRARKMFSYARDNYGDSWRLPRIRRSGRCLLPDISVIYLCDNFLMRNFQSPPSSEDPHKKETPCIAVIADCNWQVRKKALLRTSVTLWHREGERGRHGLELGVKYLTSSIVFAGDRNSPRPRLICHDASRNT